MGIITIKTKYGKKLDDAMMRMMAEGRKKTVAVRDKNGKMGITLKVKHYGFTTEWFVTQIGCNHFGIEVYPCNQIFGQWTSIDQLSRQQQLRIANAIDWSTLE